VLGNRRQKRKMKMLSWARSTTWLLALFLILLPSAMVKADGGAVRLSERVGGYQIAVFTSPTQLYAGPVDISVLVQEAVTGNWVPEVRVTIRLTAHGTGLVLEQPATTAEAANKLYRAAVFQLPTSGRWEAEITVDGPHGPAAVQFDIDAAEPPPRWIALWPWFTWPALALALFAIHQALVRRKEPSRHSQSRE
jgi:hypothetical protein